MYLSAAENSNSSYYYNADMENGKVTTMYVYESDSEVLTSKLAYNYTYDEQDRLVKKEVMRWNSVSGKWENDYSLDLIYNEDGYELSRSVWDKRTQAYLPTMEKAVYQYVTDQVVAVNLKNRPLHEKILVAVGKHLHLEGKLDTLKRMRLIDRCLKKYPFENCRRVVNFMGAYKFREVFARSVYEDVTDYPFEDITLPGPRDYDLVNRQLYGDYMTPPPVEEQNKHGTITGETEP